MTNKLIVLFLLLSNLCYSQSTITMASLSASDTKDMKELRVKFNSGIEIKLGESTAIAASNVSVDTLYVLDNRSRQEWNKVYCKIPENDSIKLVYNDCCSGFLLFNKKDRVRNSGKVTFINKTDTEKIGSLAWSSIRIPAHSSVSLVDSCNSPMHSDIVSIEVDQVNLAKTDALSKLRDHFFCFDDDEFQKYEGYEIVTLKKIYWAFLSVQEVVISIEDTAIQIQEVKQLK